jgi:glucose/arabinose dehydrogenase
MIRVQRVSNLLVAAALAVGGGLLTLAQGGHAGGAGAGVLVLKDGSMLISDDQGGRIFRVTYLR